MGKMIILKEDIQTQPKFSPFQQVQFVGGMGKIISCFADSGNWMYAVEMPLGQEPDMGRIGSETIILMSETEIYLTDALP